jgi:hypothetical protein
MLEMLIRSQMEKAPQKQSVRAISPSSASQLSPKAVPGGWPVGPAAPLWRIEHTTISPAAIWSKNHTPVG